MVRVRVRVRARVRGRRGAPWFGFGFGFGFGLGLEDGEAHLLGSEVLVEVEELEGRPVGLAQGGGEDSGVERRQRLLELRRDAREGLVLRVRVRV